MGEDNAAWYLDSELPEKGAVRQCEMLCSQ